MAACDILNLKAETHYGEFPSAERTIYALIPIAAGGSRLAQELEKVLRATIAPLCVASDGKMLTLLHRHNQPGLRQRRIAFEAPLDHPLTPFLATVGLPFIVYRAHIPCRPRTPFALANFTRSAQSLPQCSKEDSLDIHTQHDVRSCLRGSLAP
ncbi:MAG: hypothetical protein D6691_00920 [Candidatus Hydrogenedentota bacterium]|nr:MAG: hypothetical protein D6691_00920 [Candidatus Hydrogenedentota bacterium]